MKIVVIEDEAACVKSLKRFVSRSGIQHEIVAVISSVSDGIRFFNDLPEVDLIFSDIVLSDGLCFDIFRCIDLRCPVIFTTGHNQYAIDAFQHHGIDYILKPINEKSVLNALRKYINLAGLDAGQRQAKRAVHALLKRLLEGKRTSLVVDIENKKRVVPVSEISLIVFDDEGKELTTIYCENGVYKSSLSMKDLMFDLDASLFYKFDSQYIVNRTFVREIEQISPLKVVLRSANSFVKNIEIDAIEIPNFLRWLAKPY